MPDVKRQNTCDRDKNLAPKGILKELWHQSPALATLIYVDWLPTGQALFCSLLNTYIIQVNPRLYKLEVITYCLNRWSCNIIEDGRYTVCGRSK